jgi:hypothetical protein
MPGIGHDREIPGHDPFRGHAEALGGDSKRRERLRPQLRDRIDATALPEPAEQRRHFWHDARVAPKEPDRKR